MKGGTVGSPQIVQKLAGSLPNHGDLRKQPCFCADQFIGFQGQCQPVQKTHKRLDDEESGVGRV